MFSPASKARPKLPALVPATADDDATHPCCPAATPPTPDAAPHPGGAPDVSRPRRLSWVERLRRVFAQDVLPCACSGRRTVVAFVAEANLTRSLLTSLGLPAEPAMFAPARAPLRPSSPGTTPRSLALSAAPTDRTQVGMDSSALTSRKR